MSSLFECSTLAPSLVLALLIHALSARHP